MKRITTLFFCIVLCLQAVAQQRIQAMQPISELMERRDLKLADIEVLAQDYFKVKGKGQGSGYKQYQRWLYEQKFHLDPEGYIQSPQSEFAAFGQAAPNLNTSGSYGSASSFGPTSGLWTESGPIGWNQTSGWNPGVGRLTAMAVHPNGFIIYVGSPGGGLWKYTDYGVTTWTPLLDYNSDWMHIYSIALDPLNPDILYAGTGNGADQVIKSLDGGLSWIVLGPGPTGTIRKLLIDPTSTNTVFACADNGVFRSVDGGNSWAQVRTGHKEDIEFEPGNSMVLYASGNNEVVRSVDGGITWNVLSSAQGITHTGRTLISVTPADPQRVYIVQSDNSLSSFGRMYRSVNGGASFATTVVGNPSAGTNYFGYLANGTGLGGQAWHDMAMCVSPTDPNEVHIGGVLCWRSLNAGNSFTAMTDWFYPNTTGYNHADLQGLEFHYNILYSISDGGIYKSFNNGDDWIDISTGNNLSAPTMGLGIRQFYRLAGAPTNGNFFTAGAQDNGSVVTPLTPPIMNGSMNDWLGADGMEGLVSPTNFLNIWGSSQQGQLYTSTDGGNTKSTLAVIPGVSWLMPLAIHPTDENIVFAGGNAVYKSTNGGASFFNISGTTYTATLTDLAVAPSDPDVLYASLGNVLHVSVNGGATWSYFTAPGAITDICVSPFSPSKLWITTSSGSGRVFVSINGGASFSDISGALPSFAARTVVVDNTIDETVFVGMNIGVYWKSNSNSSWMAMTDNLPLVAINELDIQHATNTLRVATYGRGIWQASAVVTLPPTCPAPLVSLNETLNYVSIGVTGSWYAVPGAASYTIEFGSFATGNTTYTTTDTFKTITGLQPATPYYFHVKTNCSSGSSSNLTQATFTTQCPGAPMLTGSGVTTSTTATFNWYGLGGVVGYTAEYRVAGTSVWLPALQTTSTVSQRILTGLAPGTMYDFRFRTNCNNGSYSNWIQTSVITKCPAPLNPGYLNLTTNSVTLKWSPVAGALDYTVAYGPWGSSTSYTVTTTDTFVHLPSGALSPLLSATAYQATIHTNCLGGYSTGLSLYASLNFTTLAPVPTCAAPLLSSITVSGYSANMLIFGWAPVTGAANYTASYRVKNGGDTTWIPANTGNSLTSRTLSGLVVGTFYEFRVRTNCTNGQSSTYTQTWHNTDCTAPSSASIPSNTIGDSSAIVNWSAVVGAPAYYIEYKKSTDSNWTLDSTAALNYTMQGLVPATSYTVHIRTKCNSYAGSAFIQRVFSTACPKPTGIMAISSNNQATISWTFVPGAVSYRVEYKESGGSWLFPSVLTTSHDSLILTGLDNATNYEVRVYTNCTNSLSSATYASLQFTTQCQAPSGLYASAITNVQATMNWNAVYGAGSYSLQYRVTGSGNSGWQSPVTNIAGTSYVLNGLSANTSYEYKVKTSCSGSGSGSQGSYSTLSSFVTLSSCPVPSGLGATPYGTQAVVRWNSIPGVVNYRIEHRLHTSSGTGSWTIDSYATTDTFYLLVPLIHSTPYDVRVRANCSGSSSGNYGTAQFTTAPPCPFPANLTYGGLTDSTVTINWFIANGAQNYQLQYKKSNQNWSSSAVVTINGILDTMKHLSGLLPCTGYHVRLRSYCSPTDSSAYTNDVAFTTPSPAGTSMANPIIVPGQLPCGANTYTSTKTNSAANCFNDNLNVSNNISSSPDIWYRFTLLVPDTVVISQCGSGLPNTVIHLLNSAGIQIGYNDNNGTPSCASSWHASLSMYLAAGTYYVVSEGGGMFSSIGAITTSINRQNCYSITNVSQLDLRLFIEGYYAGAQTMIPAMMNQGIAQAASNDVDDILVELRDVNSSSFVVAADSTRLQTDGTASCLFPTLSGNYYVVVKHRNTVETWSKNPVSIGPSAGQYNFYTAATQAYGDNMKEVESGVWAFYSGDIDLNENVDLLDFSLMEDDINNFMSGYLVTDLNGDGNTDLLDSSILESNINQFIFSSHP